MIILIVVFIVGVLIGTIVIGLVSGGSRSDYEAEISRKNKRIEDQVSIIFTMRKELVMAKGAASSNELRADCLERLKNELQKDYDELDVDYKAFVQDYRKIYLELDKLKAAEARKFRTPEEIEATMKLENDFNEVINELTVIEEMLTGPKAKVSLAG